MARFGFVGPSYQSQSVNADDQLCQNWYPETLETGQGKSNMVLYPTPGLTLFSDVGAGLPPVGVRGSINWNNSQAPTVLGRYFAVIDTRLFEFFSDGTFFQYTVPGGLGAVGPVSFAASGTELMFTVSGSLYHFVGNQASYTILKITAGPPGIGQSAQVAYVDGFFVVWATNSNRVSVSAIGDGTTWPGLSTTLISVFPDNLVSMLSDHRELWLFGTKQIAVYYNSGNFPFPLDVVSGGFIEGSTIATWSPARLDNSIFWLGGDERGNAVVWRANGYTPTRVSNHAVENAIQGYAIRDDAIGYAYQDQGHPFYVLRFPNADHTWVYDVATQMWHERMWLNNDGSFSAHHSQNHAFVFGKHLVGDWATQKVYQMGIGFLDDAGNPIVRKRRAPHISQEMEWTFHHQMQLDMETNQGVVTGPAVATANTLNDSSLNQWLMTIDSIGLLHTAPTSGGTPGFLFLNDPGNTTSWQIVVSTLGVLQVVPVSLGAYPTSLQMNSTPNPPSNGFALTVTTFGLIQITPAAPFPTIRQPQITLRWSDDGGHTWSNDHTISTGDPTTLFKTRVIWRRLGRSRDRIYEVQAQDPVPWRLIDAYLLATPGFTPTERLVKQYGKSA